MKAKKRSGKGRPAGKRAVTDLAPRKPGDVKGGWALPVAPPEPKPKSKASFNDFNFPHSLDKSSPILM